MFWKIWIFSAAADFTEQRLQAFTLILVIKMLVIFIWYFIYKTLIDTLCLRNHTCLIVLIQLLICGLDIIDSLRLKIYSMLYTTCKSYAYSAYYYCLQFLYVWYQIEEIIYRINCFTLLKRIILVYCQNSVLKKTPKKPRLTVHSICIFRRYCN